MDKEQKKKLVRLTSGKIDFDCPMSQYTTFRVGGQCEALFKAEDQNELRQLVGYLNKESIPYFTAGRGSNLLIKDRGIDGLVILLKGNLASIEQDKNNESTILAGAGLPLVDLLSHCRVSGLSGVEYLAGIPGTVGGAVAMNAGAFGKEFGSRVQELHLISAKGDLKIKNHTQLKFSYRNFNTEKGAIIIRARLKLDKEPNEIVAGSISHYLKKRKQSQPLEYPSAGSVFKNPLNDYAGRLIENAGMKGKKIGGAMISNKHANFIVNTGGASATDILELLHLAQAEVKKATGIELEPEIMILGN